MSKNVALLTLRILATEMNGMKDMLYQSLNPQGKPFLWSHRLWREQPFDGFYHWHWGFEMLLVHQGRGVIIVNQKTYELAPGKLFYFLPYQLHKVFADVSAEQPYERSVFHFDPASMDRFLTPFAHLRDSFTRMRKGLEQDQELVLSDFRAEAEAAADAFQSGLAASASGSGEEECAALYLMGLLSVIGRCDRQPASDAASKPIIRHSDEVMSWIERRYAEPFRLDELAAELHMSGSYLSRLFRQETGSSITGYLTALRIQQACSLLRSGDQSVEWIGAQVGLPNASYFIHLFKRMMGVSPHQYRLKL
jgi:AraC-like DNA-binding protein